jgi:Dolichyl-phosphate-mannose-protein mannosyltransferase
LRNLRQLLAPSWLTALAVLLALGHAALATQAMRDKSTTADEIGHVTGGYTFNHWNDYRLHPENGNLPQRWEALPATLAGVNFPPLTGEFWRKSDVWNLGYQFFYRSGNDDTRLLAGARAMNSLFGAATALLVFFWSRQLWGAAGALVATVFCVLCPTLLAHSGLATSDMSMTFFLLLAVAVFWHHLQDGGWPALLLSAVVFGFAGVAKHTSVLLLPMALLMMAVRLGHPAPFRLGQRAFTHLPGKLGLLVFSLLVHGLAVGAFLWAFFGFRYTAFNPALPGGEFVYPWSMMLSFGGVKAQVIEFCRTWHLLPEGYLYGLAFVLKHAEARGAFLDGDYSIYGWVSFFPKTFLYKTPLPLLAGLAVSAGLLGLWARTIPWSRLAGHLYRVTPLLVLFSVYWAFSLTSHLNIGHRHILPTYPVLYIFCGALGWAALRAYRLTRANGTVAGLVVVALLGWQTAVTAGIYPHFLAYFSPVVGGPAEGYRHLVDSSLDWGQDLPGLKKWLAANRRPGEPLYLSYFGSGDQQQPGIDAVAMATLPDFKQPHPWHWFEPGLYAVSATMLQHVYMPLRGTWTAENERQYQELRQNDANFRALKASPDGHPELMREISPAQWSRAWTLYEQLRFARLCHYLRARQPDAMIGYSILIFRLTQPELDAALNGPASELAAAIDHAMAAGRHAHERD